MNLGNQITAASENETTYLPCPHILVFLWWNYFLGFLGGSVWYVIIQLLITLFDLCGLIIKLQTSRSLANVSYSWYSFLKPAKFKRKSRTNLLKRDFLSGPKRIA
jgi:hypothetical protein